MIKPLGSHILILPMEEANRSLDGVFLPDTSREDVKYGRVIEVGSEVKWLAKEDTVGFGIYAGISMTLYDTTFLLMLEGEGLFKVVKDE